MGGGKVEGKQQEERKRLTDGGKPEDIKGSEEKHGDVGEREWQGGGL